MILTNLDCFWECLRDATLNVWILILIIFCWDWRGRNCPAVYFSFLFLVRQTRVDGLAVELHVGVPKTRVELFIVDVLFRYGMALNFFWR